MLAKDKKQTAKDQAACFSSIVPGKRLRLMMEKDPDSVCSLIVEVQLPSRQFSFVGKGSKRLVSRGSIESARQRETELSNVADKLKRFAENGEAKVLKTAGAVVIKTQARHLKKISLVPGVKTIRENRKLPRSGIRH